MKYFKQREERQRTYERVVPIDVHNEVQTDEYLRRLSAHERSNLSALFYDLETLFRGSAGLMALAVGTTTYPEQYWTNLRTYLQEKDPSKLGFVERKGEDIDIILCPDTYQEPAQEIFLEWLKFTRKDLDKAKINYLFENGERDCGTNYLSVPTSYLEQEGQGVIRHKMREYSDSFRISYPHSREIHLGFCSMLGELKLKRERIEDNHFSLLFRHSDRHGLAELVKKIDG